MYYNILNLFIDIIKYKFYYQYEYKIILFLPWGILEQFGVSLLIKVVIIVYLLLYLFNL